MQSAAEGLASNAASIATNTQTLDHLVEVGKIYGWLAGIVVALLIYTWRQKERSQDKLELLITTHISEDDKAHSKMFDEIRNTNEKVNIIIGEHKGKSNDGG